MSSPTASPWVSQFDVLLLDLDGVVYTGAVGVPHAVESLNQAAALGVRLAYVTNNASRPPRVVVDQLAELGLSPTEADVVTSAQAGARLLSESLDPGDSVLVVGGPGLHEAVAAREFQIVNSALETPEAVVIGFSPDTGWRQLAQATYAVTAGALFVATNTDTTIPTSDGIAPGNGLLVEVVARATGVAPRVAGKPERPLMRESVERTGAVRPLVVGDRLDTDIAGARAAGLPSLLVFTGVSSILDVLRAAPNQRPDFLAADLRALLDAPVAVTGAEDGAAPDDDPNWLQNVAVAAASAWADADRGLELDLVAVAARLEAQRPPRGLTR